MIIYNKHRKMSESKEYVLKDIQRYQEGIQKCIAKENFEKILYYVSKLNKLPVTVSHLEKTGVGKTVNSLKKYDSDVGTTSAKLISKWKAMVLRNDGQSDIDEKLESDSDDCQNEDKNQDEYSPDVCDNSTKNSSSSRKRGYDESSDRDTGEKRKKEKTSAADSETQSKKKVKTKIQCIDSASGATFAEALSMCYPVTPKSQKKKSKLEKQNVTKKETISEDIPLLLKQPPVIEPTEIDMTNLLPAITPNYRPLGHVTLDTFQKKVLTEEEELCRVISTKYQKTKVFSGNKTAWGKVPSLFELCTHVLQDNIDALEVTGGVPYHIIKPILEKATPTQLYNLEHYNPYLIESTEELWMLHVQREFKDQSREEFETYREMYLRCTDEREAKLKALTANIKQAQDKSLPVRKTSYIDFVKPPRNIARKQAKLNLITTHNPTKHFNTTNKAKELAEKHVSNKNAGISSSDRTEKPQLMLKVKPKKAPLMAKTLSYMKNRFKR